MLASFHAVADARRLTSRWGGCSRVLRHTRARPVGSSPKRVLARPKEGRQSARPTQRAATPARVSAGKKNLAAPFIPPPNYAQ